MFRRNYEYCFILKCTWMQTEFAFVGIVILGVLGFLADRIFHVATTRLCARYLPG